MNYNGLFERDRMPLWKWVVGIVAAIVAAPFMAMAIGITVVLLAPFALPALPIIAYTLLTKEGPAITHVSTRARHAHRQRRWVPT